MWNLEHFVSSLVASCLGYFGGGGLGLIAVAREAFPIPPSLLCICNHPHTTGGKKPPCSWESGSWACTLSLVTAQIMNTALCCSRTTDADTVLSSGMARGHQHGFRWAVQATQISKAPRGNAVHRHPHGLGWWLRPLTSTQTLDAVGSQTQAWPLVAAKTQMWPLSQMAVQATSIHMAPSSSTA